MKIFRISLCLFASLACALAQTGLATITGTVTDPSGAVLVNVPIEVRNGATGQTFTAATSATGNYTISQLPVGDYEVVVTAPGFKSYNHTNVHLAAQQTLREDVALAVGTSTEAVTVTAE